MNTRVKAMFTQVELLEIVITMLSVATNTLAEACVCVCNALDTLLAVPPRAVVLILKVAVAVPLEHFVEVEVIVPP